jgi:hypothetical protein
VVAVAIPIEEDRLCLGLGLLLYRRRSVCFSPFVLKIMGPSSCMMIGVMVPLLYESDCSAWVGNPARRRIDFDPNDLHQCERLVQIEWKSCVYMLFGKMMLRVFH